MGYEYTCLMALKEYIASQIESGYKPYGWMVEQDLPNDDWEDLGTEHLGDGDTEKAIAVSPDYDQDPQDNPLFQMTGDAWLYGEQAD